MQITFCFENIFREAIICKISIFILEIRFFLIENLNENLNQVSPKILIFVEVLDEVLDF